MTACASLLALSLAACSGGGGSDNPPPPPPPAPQNNAPSFSISPVDVSVEENTSATLATIEASDPDGDTLAFSFTGDDASAFAFDSATGTLSFASTPDFKAPGDANGDNVYVANLKASDPVRYRDSVFTQLQVEDGVTFATVDGQTLRLTIYAPEGDTATDRPVMIVASGGGFQEQERESVEPIAEDFARRGYVAVTMDYRVLGRAPLDADELAIAGATATHDMFAAVRFLRAEGEGTNPRGIRPDAIFVSGESAGAAMAMIAATLDPSDIVSRPALVDFFADNGGVYGTVGENDAVSSVVQGAMPLSGAVFDLSSVDAASGVLYAGHEEFDPVVPCRTAAEGASFTGLVISGACDVVPAYETAGATAQLFLVSGSVGHVEFTDAQRREIYQGAAELFFNTVILTGVNDAPTANGDALSAGEDASAADVTATLLANDTDPDTGETAQLAISGIETTGTLGQVIFNAGNVTYSPNGAFESLALGQNGNDTFSYTITDPGGLTSTAAVTVTINGANDAPSAGADALTFAEEEGARDVTATLLANDSDVDSGETAQLAITGVDTTLSLGRITLTNGIVTYDPNDAFNALSEGQSATDRFDYTISDPHGATATATATVTIQGFVGYRLTIERTGLGAGSVTSEPSGIGCGSGGACEALFPPDENVTLSVAVEPTSRFQSWGGDCASANQSACALTMNQDRYAFARFELENPPAGRIVAATLPGARSGYVGGGDITVFMTVLSRQSTPAQACRITAPNDPPFTLSYRQVNAQNEVIGDANPLFDLGNGGAINFVIALTPTRTTDQSGYVFLPRIQCENADLSPIEGVNSVLVSIGAAPVPDILSIGATPSADGIVRIPATGNRISFMSAAAVNIGAGDGSAAAGEATVTASVDTGAASLPLTLEVCETASTGGCITPRGVTQVSTVFAQNVAKFFAVFVRANGEATVPFDPANARVFLRFADASGTIRSATSVAVSSPAAASDQPVLQSAMPVGRWSVLVRQGNDEWPSLDRASLFVLEDGTAILDDGTDVTRLTFEGFVAEDDIGRFETRTTGGLWTGEGNIQAGPVLSDHPGDLWGVRDARSDMAPGWDALAGQYGDGVQIESDGSISGTIAGCIVSGQAALGMEAASGMRIATVSLMSCEASGEYRGVMDVPANDDAPVLLLSGSGQGWRIGRTQ